MHLSGQHAADHHPDTEPEAEQRDLGVVGQAQHLETPGLEIDLHGGTANPEQRGANQNPAKSRRCQQVAQVEAERGHTGREADGGIAGGRRHENIAGQCRAEDAGHHAVGDQHAVLEHVGQDGAGDGPAQDREEGEQLDRAVGLDQPGPGEDFRQDAIFGRAVEARADADRQVANALPDGSVANAQGTQPGAEQFQPVAAHEPAGLGVAVVEIAGQRCQQHVGDKQQTGIDRIPGSQLRRGDGARLLQIGQLPHDDGQDGVVAQRAEELSGKQERVVAAGRHWRWGEEGKSLVEFRAGLAAEKRFACAVANPGCQQAAGARKPEVRV